MKIAILDQENARVIVSSVPDYLENANASSDDIAQAIMTALGLSDCEYMIGNFTLNIDHDARNDNGAMHRIEELTQDFKDDALEALNDLIA